MSRAPDVGAGRPSARHAQDAAGQRRPQPGWRLLLLAIVALGLLFRVAALDTYGVSEDEAAKIRAIEAYQRGDLTANAEHPMLMKLAIWASLAAAESWNAAAPQGMAVAAETALRLPNAIAGGATVAAAGGLARLLFGTAAGLMAALIVALDPNVTAINRLGKEDTFLMFFLMAGMYFYERGKVAGISDPRGAQRWYSASGASFGLMLASKYMPHFFGMYALFNKVAVRNAGLNRPWKGRYYGLMGAAFLVANVAILFPDTWQYCLEYVRGDHAPHYGYTYNGRLYGNAAATPVPYGVPATYYLHLIVTKVPLTVLAGCAIGAIPLVARRHERGFIWIRVFLVFTVLSYSLFGSKFLRYALPMLLVLDVLAAAGFALAFDWLLGRRWASGQRAVVSAGAAALLVALLAWPQVAAAPFFSAHQNLLGAALAPPVTTFPEEAYDYGVREAAHEIAANAGQGAAVVSDAPMAVEYYVRRLGRDDLQLRSLSQDGMPMQGEQWVLVQDSHIYFENALMVAQLRQRERPWREFRLRDTVVLQLYRLER